MAAKGLLLIMAIFLLLVGLLVFAKTRPAIAEGNARVEMLLNSGTSSPT
jgi:hypothetical protein